MLAGTGTACGLAAAANTTRANRCGGSNSANSGSSGGEENQPPSPERGKSSVAKRGQTDVAGSAAGNGSGEAVTIGDAQERAKSCRNEEAAQRTAAQQTKRQRERVPDGRETAPATNASSPVDSPHPIDRTTPPALNEETDPGLSSRPPATGAGDPPYGRDWAGEPTKETPRCNGADTLNSAVISPVEETQQPTSEPSKQDVHSVNWQAVDRSELEAWVFRKQRAIHEAFKQGNVTRGHRLQMGLLGSHDARLLAVRNATDPTKGANTAGIDGQRSLSDSDKWRLAQTIRWDRKPSPVRRVLIPKPGKNEYRPLGIPTIRDRAIQHLIKLALEPAAETLLAPEQFGFRPGRSPWDAAIHIRLRLRQPSFVLDADITRFFDRIDHDTILRVIPGTPCLKKAIRRLLKAGVMDGVDLTHSETGTPQGGPLSPLLANLILASLAADLRREFPVGRIINGEKIAKTPYICIFADDFIGVHARKDVLEQVRASVEQWLAVRGLELHPDKTEIRHTAIIADGYRGFRFLGFAFQHHWIGKHQGGGNGPRWFKWTGPSPEALQRVYAKCAEVIDSSKRSRKRNGAISDKTLMGKATPEEIMVIRLNQIIRGWCNYHRPFYAKKTFSKLDHLLFTKLWKWTLRKYPSRQRAWVIQRHWNNAKPWRFTVMSAKTGKPIQLIKASDIPITRHFPVKPEKTWFDGNWAYWAKRAGHYPMLTTSAATALKRQQGRCPHCKKTIVSEDRVILVRHQQAKGPRTCVMHRHCADALPNATTEPVFVGSVMIAARCGDDSHAGLTEPVASRGAAGSTTDRMRPRACPKSTSHRGQKIRPR